MWGYRGRIALRGGLPGGMYWKSNLTQKKFNLASSAPQKGNGFMIISFACGAFCSITSQILSKNEGKVSYHHPFSGLVRCFHVSKWRPIEGEIHRLVCGDIQIAFDLIGLYYRVSLRMDFLSLGSKKERFCPREKTKRKITTYKGRHRKRPWDGEI